MPASIAHMLLAKRVRVELQANAALKDFVNDVLVKHSTFMELGALGPDLPYYKGINLVIAGYRAYRDRPDKPAGVDQWSYQTHSLKPNKFPLEMLKTMFEDRPFDNEPWEIEDHKKFAFICGYLTHMAADQMIHPVINLIAGPYYKTNAARTTHREAEAAQDVYLFSQNLLLSQTGDFREEKFDSWCDVKRDRDADPGDDSSFLRFKYLIQRALLETYFVTPTEDDIDDWIDGTLNVLKFVNGIGPFGLYGPYKQALENISDQDKFNLFIELKPSPDATKEKKEAYKALIGDKNYLDFFGFAVELATIYVRTAIRIFRSKDLTKELEKRYKGIVSDADLGAPLENDILETTQKAFNEWPEAAVTSKKSEEKSGPK
ncbi:MAG: zinc dependent phospholipase C family protein [Deltaproteobacteria bacterium]|nr:zinc dependent phospholipase C family protein [Deltaproteobacteria bacterium]